ncbi:hypothetical protein MNBD_BACTEROID01-2662 [hydrothermal vent metagenome]|uniref:Uncharacterized protein n=1 Tax=hydrothermal vent metagenome TaxID=652676 RepID=A0A3B0U1G1_9ZZZZ
MCVAHVTQIKLLTKLFGYFRGAINNSKPSRNYITQTRRLELDYNLR